MHKNILFFVLALTTLSLPGTKIMAVTKSFSQTKDCISSCAEIKASASLCEAIVVKPIKQFTVSTKRNLQEFSYFDFLAPQKQNQQNIFCLVKNIFQKSALSKNKYKKSITFLQTVH